jgi:purine-binding chemotaxis protein CheW
MNNTQTHGGMSASSGADPSAPSHQYITFTIGEREFAVDIMAVREIRGWTATTKIPNAPRAILGVINLRGTIIPVLDLRASFGEELTVVTPAHVVIIVVIGARTAGILVDAVSDILTVGQDQLQDIPEVERQGRDAMVREVILVNQRLVGVLSLERLISQSQLELTDKVTV